MIACAISPAMAQGKGLKHDAKAPASDPNAAKKIKADNEAYQRALKSIPDAKPVTDPWQGAR